MPQYTYFDDVTNIDGLANWDTLTGNTIPVYTSDVFLYNIRQLAACPISLNYNVRAIVNITESLNYHIRAIVNITESLNYHIRILTNRAYSFQYHVRNLTDVFYEVLYDIKNLVNRAGRYLYDIGRSSKVRKNEYARENSINGNAYTKKSGLVYGAPVDRLDNVNAEIM